MTMKKAPHSNPSAHQRRGSGSVQVANSCMPHSYRSDVRASASPACCRGALAGSKHGSPHAEGDAEPAEQHAGKCEG
jgi:hypothetical protein